MQYMLMFREPTEAFAVRTDPERSDAYWGAWMSFIGAMRDAGVMVNGNGLMPPHTSSTVKVRNGRREVQDGPYADAKEQLGGYVVIEVDDLDAALDWAAKAPSAESASVEVRPVLRSNPDATATGATAEAVAG